MSGARLVAIAMEQNLKLYEYPYKRKTNKKGNKRDKKTKNVILLKEFETYRHLVSRLLYLTVIKLDICFLMQVLINVCNNQEKLIWKQAMRVVLFKRE